MHQFLLPLHTLRPFASTFTHPVASLPIRRTTNICTRCLVSSLTILKSSPRASFAPSPSHISSSAPRVRISSYSTLVSREKRQNRLPASYYRGGTSRAVIFRENDLPSDRTLWPAIFRSVVGSPDQNGRQLDGMGGGVSSLSKVCVVGPASVEEADVDYTFAAIGVRDDEVDFSSNCGNMTSAIGPYAFDTGLVGDNAGEEVPEGGEDWVQWGGEQEGMATVRIHNTNTGKIIHARFPVVDGEATAEGSFAIDGVAGTGARIEMAFLNPSGSKTGKLLPTGNVVDVFQGVEATCIDVGNPCVFVRAKDLGVDGAILPDEMDADAKLMEVLESIRRQAAVKMGICTSLSSTPGSIPKIAMVSPRASHELLSGETIDAKSIDLVVRALSVGQPHRAVPITVAMAIAAAARVEGSTVYSVVEKGADRVDEAGITLGHSSGKIVVGSTWGEEGELKEAKVYRTARRLMDGWVYWR